MSWIYIVLISQLIFAFVALVDRFILISKRAVSRPIVYSIYVGFLSGVVLVLLPYGVLSSYSPFIVYLSLITGGASVAYLIFLYLAFQGSDASDVAPAVAAVSAVSSLVFSIWLLGTIPGQNHLIVFSLLVAGTFLMSYFRFSRRTALYVIWAGVTFGLAAVTVKMIFNEISFLDGFFWSRMGNVIIAGSLLLWPGNLRKMKENIKTASYKTKYWIIGNKALAGIAFFLTLVAFNLSDVSLVNALGGVQFVFLLILGFILTRAFPEYFKETFHYKKVVIQKVSATLLIVFGLFLLFI